MLREFRGQLVEEWHIVEAETAWGLTDKLNKLLDVYNFVDCQYSVHVVVGIPASRTYYSALVLLAKKTPQS